VLRDPFSRDVVAQLLEGLDGPLPLAFLLSGLQAIVPPLVIEGPLSKEMLDDHQNFMRDGHCRFLPTQAYTYCISRRNFCGGKQLRAR
jgi:hypothetical protein